MRVARSTEVTPDRPVKIGGSINAFAVTQHSIRRKRIDEFSHYTQVITHFFKLRLHVV